MQQQYELVQAVNKWPLKGIWQSKQKNTERLNQKWLEIPVGNLVLLCDHPEGCNKINDRYKSEEFVVVGRCPELKVSCITPVNSNGPVQTINQCQIQDLWKTQNDGGLTSPQYNHDGSQVRFLIQNWIWPNPPYTHQYATHSKGRTPMLSLSTTAGVVHGGLRPAQAQRAFCSRYTQSFWI